MVSLWAVPAYADFNLPHTFLSTEGGLTINGLPAPIGTEVKAVCSGADYGTWDAGSNPFITTSSGKYGDPGAGAARLAVQGTIDQGTTIHFYVNGVDTGTTYPYDGSGASTVLDLSVNGLPTIASYSNAEHTTYCDTFDDYSTEHIVYMWCSGNLTASSSYKVVYYDGGGTKQATETRTAGTSGNISSQHTFQPLNDAAGTWHVLVCAASETPPSTYGEVTTISTPLWGTILASDTFTVQESAIPEFPTVLAVIVALSLCAGIYLWMRRKATPIPA